MTQRKNLRVHSYIVDEWHMNQVPAVLGMFDIVTPVKYCYTSFRYTKSGVSHSANRIRIKAGGFLSLCFSAFVLKLICRYKSSVGINRKQAGKYTQISLFREYPALNVEPEQQELTHTGQWPESRVSGE